MDIHFYSEVKRLARRNNTTIKYVVEKAGISLDSYNTLRREGKFPRFDIAMNIANFFKVPAESLFRKENQINNDTEKDYKLLFLAQKWRQLLIDLDSLSPEVAAGIALSVHGAAEASPPEEIETEHTSQNAG